MDADSARTTPGISMRYTVLHQQLRTGQKIIRPSQAPMAAATAIALRADGGSHSTITRSLEDGARWAEHTRLALRDALVLVERMSTAHDKDTAMAAAEQLLAIANTRLDGRPIFAGTRATDAAYDAKGRYLGNRTPVVRLVALDGTELNVSLPGPEAFGEGRTGALAILRRRGTRRLPRPRLRDRGIEAARRRLAEALKQADATARSIAQHTTRMRELSQAHCHRLSQSESVDTAAAFALIKRHESDLLDALTLRPTTTLNSLSDFLR